MDCQVGPVLGVLLVVVLLHHLFVVESKSSQGTGDQQGKDYEKESGSSYHFITNNLTIIDMFGFL